jgi:hypothetical protein
MGSWVDAQLDDPKVARAAFEETFKEYTAAVAERDVYKKALASVDNHLRAIIVYAKSGSELESTARDARKVIETALGQ